MKWFFGFNAATDWYPDYIRFIKCSINSAKQNTSLEPHFLYDGDPCDLTKWAEDKGATVHFVRSRFYNYFYSLTWSGAKVASGAYLRAEIPKLVIENYSDEYVLYTDCDVMFLGNVEALDKLKPKYFSCATEISQNNYSYFNSGVMLMNVRNLHNTTDEFDKFVYSSPMDVLCKYDQETYNKVYFQRWGILPNIYNWKPYWGPNVDARIIHFHGLKAGNIDRVLNGEKLENVLQWMYGKAPEYYKELYSKVKEFEKL